MMNIHAAQLSWTDIDALKRPNEMLRRDIGIGLYFLDCTTIPFSFAFMTAPRDYVFTSMPRTNRTTTTEAVDVGPVQASWTRDAMANSLPAFLREFRSHQVKVSGLPEGLIPFQDSATGESLPQGSNTPLLSDLHFRSFLIPRKDNSKATLSSVLQKVVDDRGVYGCKPFRDAEFERLCQSRDWWQYQLSGLPATWETRAFVSFVLADDSVPFREVRVCEDAAIEFMTKALGDAEHGKTPRFEDLTPVISELWTPVLRFATEDRLQTQGRAGRVAETISALRIQLIRMLGWPVFYWIVASYANVLARRVQLKPAISLPISFCPSVAAEAYVTEVRTRFSTYEQGVLDAVWKP